MAYTICDQTYLLQDASRKCVTVMPLVRCMDWLHWWYKHVAHVVFSSTELAVLINTTEKRKSTLPSAIKAKKWWKTIGIKEKLDIISRLEKGEQNVVLTTYDSLTVPYVKVMIMLIELEKVSSQELQCWYSKTTTVLLEWTITKLWMRVFYIFNALEPNKYIVQKCMYTV